MKDRVWSGMPEHNALARIGPAVTMPGREPHASGFCGTDKAQTGCALAQKSTPQRSTRLSFRSSGLLRFTTILRRITLWEEPRRLSSRWLLPPWCYV